MEGGIVAGGNGLRAMLFDFNSSKMGAERRAYSAARRQADPPFVSGERRPEMRGGARFSKADIEELPDEYRMQIEDQLAGNSNSEQKSGQQPTLEFPGTASQGMVHLDGEILVRITRVGHRRLDDDNLAGGCKELRDAIAAMLGRKGDSEKDGLKWEYIQETGPTETRIEICQIKQ